MIERFINTLKAVAAVAAVLLPIAVITGILIAGINVAETARYQASYEECNKYYNSSDFQTENVSRGFTSDLVCVKDGDIYKPNLGLIEIFESLFDVEAPAWAVWLPVILPVYLSGAILFGVAFGCRCGLMNPMGLIWPVILVAAILLALVQALWKFGLWPERLVQHCGGCGEPIAPAEGGCRSSEFDGVFCSYSCLEEVKSQ